MELLTDFVLGAVSVKKKGQKNISKKLKLEDLLKLEKQEQILSENEKISTDHKVRVYVTFCVSFLDCHRRACISVADGFIFSNQCQQQYCRRRRPSLASSKLLQIQLSLQK